MRRVSEDRTLLHPRHGLFGVAWDFRLDEARVGSVEVAYLAE